jgi:NTP pyrophosphatase (non-canonical NTP hydrolase)
MHHTVSLCGEVGEVANWVKKIDRGDVKLEDALTQHELREEIADVFIYLLNLAGLLNVDLYKAYCEKRAINEKRWGGK